MSGSKIQNQKLEGGNMRMERSMNYGKEIRVIKGHKYLNRNSINPKVYVNDGLYKIVECCYALG